MKKIRIFLLLPFFLLSGCFAGPPLLTENYSRMEVVKDGELFFETENADEIEQAVNTINNGRREETHEWELPEPLGTLTFQGKDEGATLVLFESGVTVDEYFVYMEFDFD